jgi:hypothetical protein
MVSKPQTTDTFSTLFSAIPHPQSAIPGDFLSVPASLAWEEWEEWKIWEEIVCVRASRLAFREVFFNLTDLL